MVNHDNFSKRIRKLRKENKYTLTDVKKKTGINEGYLSKLERGIMKNPTMDILKKLAALYNVTTNYLIGKDPFKNKVEAHHSISIALVKLFKDNPEKIPSHWEVTSVFSKLVENNVSKEIMSYCESMVSANFSRFQ